jgi:hypothetical protein
VLSFWPSDVGLLATQAALVCGPRPEPPVPTERLRGSLWSWVMPLSLGGTIAVLAVAPGLAQVYAWVAVIGIPLLAVPSIAALLAAWLPGPGRSSPGLWGLGLACAAALLGFAWVVQSGLLAQLAAVALTALSATTLASYLASVTPTPWLKVGLLAMATLDAYLVFAQLLQGPNEALEVAAPGAHLPQLQIAVFGTAVVGYGDLFIAAVLGTILVADPRLSAAIRPWQGAVCVFLCALVFDQLFHVIDVLPATVPVALTLVGLEIWVRRGWRTSAG